jgi:dimethylglycine dehydrogenase
MSTQPLPRHVRVVVIGGGIVGTSVLYHLAREGWSDCLLLEKAELTSGSTWHAAGAITHSLANSTLQQIADYGIGLYQRLEALTGQAVSWHGCGSLRLAYSNDELDFLQQILSVGRALGHPMEIISPDEMARLHPFYRTEGVRAALHTPADGHVDPAGATFAFAKGARDLGARIVRHIRVTGIERRQSGEWRVMTEQGDVTCDMVVNAGGTYARQIGQWVGVDLPVVSAAHQYLLTEPLEALANRTGEVPLLRDAHGMSAYFRQEQASILMGFYEKHNPHLVWLDGTPWEAENELFEPDLDSIAPSLEIALERMPILAEAGIRRVVNGAIMYTPDGAMLLGPAPGVRNFWCACGVSVGVAWGPGVGKYLAQLMVHGAADINMRAFDPRRFGPWCDRAYAVAKVREDYVLRHEVAFPGRDRPAARPVRTSALYDALRKGGAVFEQLGGWERPAWFARDGAPQSHVESFRRTSVLAMVEREANAVRERAGLLDLSGFGKVEIAGRNATVFLDRMTTNHVPHEVGGIVLTYLLNARGTIEAELTCTKTSEDRFYLLFAALDETRVVDWLTQHKRRDEDIQIRNLSGERGCLVLAGPASRAVLAMLTKDRLDNEAFPWMTARRIEVAGKEALALRLSLVGELGWELHARMEDLPHLYAALREAGVRHGVENFGTAALNAMRVEKAHRGTRELNATSTLAQNGMMRFAKLTKGEFVGRSAVEQELQAPQEWKCAYLEVDAADSDCHGSEAVLHDGEVIGNVSSGAWGPSVRRSLAFAFVKAPFAEPDTELQVMLLGRLQSARVLSESAYDPSGAQLRS